MLIVLRFLLGVAEAGFFPGIILYLTYWFPASQRARMTALFMTAIPISTALGAVVSTLIIQNWHGLFGLSGWRVMFLVEGIPVDPARRSSCWFYAHRPAVRGGVDAAGRAEALESRLATEADRGRRRQARRRCSDALTSPRVLALACVYFGVVYGLYALGFFLPDDRQGLRRAVRHQVLAPSSRA